MICLIEGKQNPEFTDITLIFFISFPAAKSLGSYEYFE